MKLLTILAASLTIASAGQVFNQVPAEVYQALDYQQNQDVQQNGWQAIDGGYQGQQLVQAVQDHHTQHQNIETHHIQVPQPQQYQNHQQHQIQSQLQHLQGQQENSHFQHQPQHVQIQPQHVQFNQHSQIGEIDYSGQQNQYSGVNQLNRQAKIMSYQHDNDGHNYQYAFETENGIKAQEVGSMEGDGLKTQGAYSYTGDDGRVYTVTYTADENGFHPSGDHLPTPPPLPAAIARSVENNLRDEANGIVDDGSYHEQQQEQYTLQSQQHQQKQAPPQGLLQQVQRHNYEQTEQSNNKAVKTKQQKQAASQHLQQKQQQAIRVPHTKQEPQRVIVHQVPQQQEPQIAHQTVQQLQQIHQQQLLQQEHLQQQLLQQQLLQQQNIQQQLLQQQIREQQLPQKMYLRFQRQQKPVRPQTQVSVVKSIEPHAAVHGQVQYAVPASAFAGLKALRTDDYVGPAPAPVSAPVTEHQY